MEISICCLCGFLQVPPPTAQKYLCLGRPEIKLPQDVWERMVCVLRLMYSHQIFFMNKPKVQSIKSDLQLHIIKDIFYSNYGEIPDLLIQDIFLFRTCDMMTCIDGLV